VNALVGAESETGTDAFLLLAVIEQESHHDPPARSPRGPPRADAATAHDAYEAVVVEPEEDPTGGVSRTSC
jgi:hypothetical protein